MTDKEQTIGFCKGCKSENVPLQKVSIKLPTGQVATSQDMVCSSCSEKLHVAFE